MFTRDAHAVWVFDFDGTLVDSMTHFGDLAARVIAQYYGTPETTAREQYRQTSGWPFVEQIGRLYPGDPRNADAVAAFESAKAARYFDRPLFPETRATIAALRARGCRVAISSNNIQALVEGYCRAHDLSVDIVCGWTPTFCKGPAHFNHIAAATDRSTDQLIFVGDSLKDARTAATHSIPFVARAGTFSAAEFQAEHPTVPVVHSLAELLQGLTSLTPQNLWFCCAQRQSRCLPPPPAKPRQAAGLPQREANSKSLRSEMEPPPHGSKARWNPL